MTSYFDDARTEVTEAWDQNSVKGVEAGIIETVNLVTGDREFPDELREKIQGIIAVNRLEYPDGKLNERANNWLEMMRDSKLIAELHSAFHEVASGGYQTRFGRLTDNPQGILCRRDDWLTNREEECRTCR